MNDVTIGSLFDGICGFPYAGSMCGAKTLFTSEIEPFPIAVAKTRFPDAEHYLDVSQLNGAEVPPVSIVTFGSPCQDMSVAGKQRGMKHEDQGDDETTRSGLFFEAVRIIKEMRKATNGEYPRFAVWENVPGAFSSNQGRDFLAVLQALASVADHTVSIPEPKGLRWAYAGCVVGDGYSIAWRTYDAQYWGVPQRRRRIYLVADFATERAGQILFESYSLSGHSAPGDEAGKETPADAVGCPDRGVGAVGFEPGAMTRDMGERAWAEICPTLRAQMGDNQPAVAYPEPLAVDGYNQTTSDVMGALRAGKADQDHVGCVVYPDTARTLAARYDSSPCDDRGQNVVVQPALFMAGQGAKAGSIAYSDGVSPTLKGCASGLNQAPSVVAFAQNQRDEVRDLQGVAGALAAEPGMKQQTYICEEQPVICLQANGIDRADTAGCNGAGWRENEAYTLNTIDRHAVVYPETVGTLAASGAGLNRPAGQGNELDFCITTVYPKVTGPLMANSHPGSYSGQDAYSDMLPVVPGNHPRRYIVRRLTPTECLRLQGYPDDWCDIAPSNDTAFWNRVRTVYAQIMGKTSKPLADVSGYVSKLKTDASIYKAAGNSLAIPCAYDVLRRCVDDEWNRLGGMYL